MFENLKNLGSMLGQAKQMREKMAQMQEELGRQKVEGESGAGAVRVTVNGKFEVLNIELDKAMLQTLVAPEGGASDDDLKMIEDLIAAAMNQAMAKARDLVQEKFREITGGMNIPGLDKLMGA